tara:strand:- start:1041 stop:1601 length:561 start_codon:yes stop_codon:yes gene_type:complete
MYQIVYADPPWDYNRVQHRGKGKPTSGGAATHYNTHNAKDIAKLDVASICDKDCLLFLWTTSPHLDQAFDLIRAWGFKHATIAFVWDKQRSNPGYYTMSQVEICLVAKRGKIPQPRGARNIRQLVSEKRRAHSQKPDEVRKRIEAMFPTQKKIELFARCRPEGWDVWGNEAGESPKWVCERLFLAP